MSTIICIFKALFYLNGAQSALRCHIIHTCWHKLLPKVPSMAQLQEPFGVEDTLTRNSGGAGVVS